MLRRSLIVTALLAVSSPLAAQEEYVWSPDRPDADAPIGVWGATTLDQGGIELSYRFTQYNSRGVWFANDSLPLAQTLQLYTVAPLTLSRQTHTVMGAYGVSDRLTVMASAEFGVYEREQLTDGGVYYITSTQALGDVTAKAVYEIYGAGPFRMNMSLGGVIPVGASRTYAMTPFSGTGEEALPYDMRPGGGTFGVLPGISGTVQNEYGSLGAQFEARINVTDGLSDYTPGDRYEASGWAAYRFNDVVSVSAGIRWAMWGNIDGADPQLDSTQDPGSDPVFLSGQRADMPIGINFVIPGSSPLAGHRLFVETVYAMHHDYEGAQLGLDWGLNLGWKMGL